MKVLVTGANGFLGKRVVSCLVGAGHGVHALVRPATDVAHLDWNETKVQVFRADLRSPRGLDQALAGVDAVVHLATTMVGDDFSILSGTIVGTENLLSAIVASPVRRLVLCSSFSVYDWRRARGTHDERTPLLADPHAAGAYAAAKTWQERLAERAVASHGLELTVLRPGFIWGRGNEDLACLGQRFGGTQLVFGRRRRLPLTHVENCADAFRAALEHPAAVGETFNLVDGDRVRAGRYTRELLQGTGDDARRLHLPYWLVRLGVSLANLGSRMIFGKSGKLPSMFVPVRFELRYKPLRFSNAKLRKLLDWHPPLDFAQCLQRTYGPEDVVARPSHSRAA